MDPAFPDSDSTENVPARQTGRMLFSRYELLRVLGRGRYATVWLAADRRLVISVAVKLFSGEIAGDESVLDELRNETCRALALTHPHIVRIHDFIADEREAAIVMQYVPGATLDEARRRSPSGVLEWETLAPWMAQLCSALEYAHTEGRIVHRDLKPANLIVGTDGVLRVADFGQAAPLDWATTRRSAGDGGPALSGYASPQQLAGGAATVADDVFSVGVTLFELLTGHLPFPEGGERVGRVGAAPLVNQVLLERGDTSHQIPDFVEAAIASCLARNPAQRPPSIAALAQLLAGGRGASAVGGTSHEESGSGAAAARFPGASGLRRALWPVMLVLAVFGGGLAGWCLTDPPEARRAEAPAGPVATSSGPRKKGGLVVRTKPAAAVVAVERVAIDRAPLVLTDQPVGTYRVRASEKGYEDWSGEVALRPDDFVELDVALVPAVGNVEVVSQPAGLACSVRGERGRMHGRTPCRFAGLPAGEHVVVVTRRPGWEVRRQVTVQARRTAPVSVELEGGSVLVETEPAGIEVWCAGARMGKTPCVLEEQVPGPIELEFRQAGAVLTTASAVVRENERTMVRMNLRARMANQGR